METFDLTVITPTRDRPEGVKLAERWMARQDFTGSVQWIVSDDGATPATLTMGQHHVRRRHTPDEPGYASLCNNLLAAIPMVRGRVVAIVEDDDCYKPGHLSQVVCRLNSGVVAVGDRVQRYYNVRHRLWRVFDNGGGVLCQTAFSYDVLGVFEAAVRDCLSRGSYGIDGAFWNMLTERGYPTGAYTGECEGCVTCIGIKGLPGLVGNGVGHRPNPATWNADRDGLQLRKWCGDDAAVYERFYEESA